LGSIGKAGFKEILNNKYFDNIPIIMETPVDKIRGDKENMATVLELLEDNINE
jgi:endonuclease IV